ncbi:MAG TPA: hypothetical protein V6D22_08350 [Candidatus Obscuribacterales bacterium]
METLTREAALLEEAVCESKEKELHLICNAQSGRGWVEVGGRRFVGRTYVQAARGLHANEKLNLKHTDATREVFELGHHVCAKAAK